MKLVLLLLYYVFISSINAQSQEEVNYFVQLIQELGKNASTYQLPTSAKQFAATEPDVEDFGTYDFVIIGSGSAGSVIANRLTENPEWKVLLLEAGGFGNNLTYVPALIFDDQYTDFNWGYTSTPQKYSAQGCVNHTMNFPRGKGIGGTTLINGMMYIRGHKSIFDLLEKDGNPGWSYEDVLPYFKKSENFVHRDPSTPYEAEFHGTDGPLRVEQHLPHSVQLDAFLEANQELGIPLVDYNSNKLGASPSQYNALNGSRFDNGRAFIKPILHRPNLKVSTFSYATKLKMKCKKTTGVYFTKDHKNYLVNARKEIIVSAGAIGSPQLLLLSGIGPKKHLHEMGINLVQDSPVGSTFRDQPLFYGLIFGTNYTEPIRPLEDYVEDFLKGYGPLAAPANDQGLGFYESSFTKGTGIPDVELMMVPSNSSAPIEKRVLNWQEDIYEDLLEHNDPSNHFRFFVIAAYEGSLGTLRLKSKDPFEYPLIDPKMLSREREVQVLLEGIQLALKLVDTQAFKKLNTTLKGRLRACEQEYLSTEYWKCAIEKLTVSVYHPYGTCPMGPDPRKSVVDSSLKVHGVKGLRVADASIWPKALPGHPNAPTSMVGEKVSDLIKKEYQ